MALGVECDDHCDQHGVDHVELHDVDHDDVDHGVSHDAGHDDLRDGLGVRRDALNGQHDGQYDPDGLHGLDGLDGPGGYYINGSGLKALDV